MNKVNNGVWTIYTDGATCNTTDRSGIGVVIFAPGATEPAETIGVGISFCTSHAAEYRAVIRGLKAAHKRGAQMVELRSDLQTMIKQLCGETKVNAVHLKPLHAEAAKIAERFTSVKWQYVERGLNAQADKLAKQGMSKSVAAPPPPATITAKPITPVPVMPAPVPEPSPTQFYKPVGDELHLWNTERLWQIAEKSSTQLMPVADLEAHCNALGWFGSEPLTVRRVALMARAVREADADKPLLLFGDELVDGQFRLAQAISENRTEIVIKRLARLPTPCARYPLRFAP